ncbi:hypothetical protein [Streptomyces thermolilacinus]|uniref:Uncharacterized protein n=1 Tax=Streptomyces thermolilacinus SPC6 TaxID=1306406 RepID=A0A1D3DLH1_9ACTN|nr:hypothetical protein [Streptomyces thermolilacinus]OEJ93162.1 hypothetical protein J116_000295 [Streptomyces thermolilacinus SPC6]
MSAARTSSPPGVRIEAMSVKGRYFLFAQEPPTVMIVDAVTVLLIRLAQSQSQSQSAPPEQPERAESLRERFRGLMARRGTDGDTSDRLFDDAVGALRTAGLGRLVEDPANRADPAP